MKICITCKCELGFEYFGKNKRYKDGYRSECKECRNAKLRTGKPNLGRFQKGHIPTHGFKKGQKTSKPFPKGHIPWNKGKHDSQYRPKRTYEWGRQVKERDGYECKKCGSKENLEAHHIIPWKENKLLRFEINNGLTLCVRCHRKIEPGRKKGYIPSEESRKKASVTSKGQRRSIETEFKKGHSSYWKGKKIPSEVIEKMRKKLIGRIPWNKGLKRNK